MALISAMCDNFHSPLWSDDEHIHQDNNHRSSNGSHNQQGNNHTSSNASSITIAGCRRSSSYWLIIEASRPCPLQVTEACSVTGANPISTAFQSISAKGTKACIEVCCHTSLAHTHLILSTFNVIHDITWVSYFRIIRPIADG